MFGIREKVDRLNGGGGISIFGENLQIAGESFRIAGDVDDLLWSVRDHGFGKGFAEACPRRICKNGVKTLFRIFQGFQGVPADKPDIVQLIEAGCFFAHSMDGFTSSIPVTFPPLRAASIPMSPTPQ